MGITTGDLIANGNSHISKRLAAAQKLLDKFFKIRLGRGLYGECLVKNNSLWRFLYVGKIHNNQYTMKSMRAQLNVCQGLEYFVSALHNMLYSCLLDLFQSSIGVPYSRLFMLSNITSISFIIVIFVSLSLDD